MALWTDFAAAAPRIAEVFTRRHAVTGNLCMLGTLRPDGFPRISPMEPRFLEGDLWLVGMPSTAKFEDLRADPRFALHTATVDTQVSDGDAKLWGRVEDVRDEALHQRFAEAVFEDIGLDLRGQEFEQFYRADIVGAASVAVGDEHMDVTTWREGAAEKVVRKH
ncbi:pyridoxamine 5'-phosphate oxidase [Actinomycetospora succinea]|uniref:Pyridoxamine 5'-phosphate oxidase n=1 Tax=Actinomycetospora succinea TaxID=663603 RepID=A0A4V6PWY1_9PSEU|nr:pyridoxamine 5'-phosphate oxidase family protein [Actinomycetospora succinea]TDQ55790.1 pyridoxamine 5'-phosphate oxidase [Actinomycetospora succinea]